MGVEKAHQKDDQDEYNHGHPVIVQDSADGGLILCRAFGKGAIEPAEKSALLMFMSFGNRLQQGSAERRRQRHRQENGEQHRRN